MRVSAGLWIDHREAVIVFILAKGEMTKIIESNVESQLSRVDGVRSSVAYESLLVPADDRQQNALTGHLNDYYDEVAAAIRDVKSVLIFGPGEAKGELKRRMKKENVNTHVVAVETVDKMTIPQIAAKVREYSGKPE